MTELPITEKHHCRCGHHDADALPILDARDIPHAIRHATILGALSSLTKGHSMGLIAPHNPLPLLSQIEELHGQRFQVSYLSEDPWTLKFTHA